MTFLLFVYTVQTLEILTTNALYGNHSELMNTGKADARQ